MSGRVRELAAALAHDVGKYVGRTARNLPGRSIDGALARMLLADVYETWRGRPASHRFEALAAELAAEGFEDARLEAARAALAAIDGLEARARAGDAAALAEVALRAREAETVIRAVARDAAAPGGGRS